MLKQEDRCQFEAGLDCLAYTISKYQKKSQLEKTGSSKAPRQDDKCVSHWDPNLKTKVLGS